MEKKAIAISLLTPSKKEIGQTERVIEK